MSISTPYYGLNRRIYMPQVKEGTYDEGDTIAAGLTFAFNARRNEGNALRTSLLKMYDDEMATGQEFASQDIHMGRDFPPTSIPLYLTPEGLGLFGAFAMGNDTVTAIETNQSYVHTLTMAALSAGYPGSFGIEEHMNGAAKVDATDENLKGCVVDEFTVSGGRTGLCNLDVTISGSGSRGTVADATESGMSIPGPDSCYFPADAIQIGVKAVTDEHDPGPLAYATPGGASTDAGTFAFATTGNGFTLLGDLIESWSVTYRNVWVLRRAAGTSTNSGLVGMCPVWSRREVDCNLTFRESASFNSWVQAFIAGTTSNNVEYQIAIEGTSDFDLGDDNFASFGIHLPLVSGNNQTGNFGEINQGSVDLKVKKQNAGAEDYDPIRVFAHDDTATAYNQ